MMKHFSLKTEWFDVGDCATMTVVYLAIKSIASCPIASVTTILFEGFFELCEIVESRPTCNCNLVKNFYK